MNPHISTNPFREFGAGYYFHSTTTFARDLAQTCADDDHPLYWTSRTSLLHLIQESLVISLERTSFLKRVPTVPPHGSRQETALLKPQYAFSADNFKTQFNS
ncbi:hypothetical protein J6590_092497 [Homalodisca vitripennis]|nr:hypothetical protein J6590_088401 [Homalodisca vitripennis]KAG8324424.1 hypothetical protein J6590_092497 [Homalodisca vitripennis]